LWPKLDFHNYEPAQALFRDAFACARDVDNVYPTDSRFEAGDVVEKRSEIRRRFQDHLGTLFKQFVAGNLPRMSVFSSHFEVLYPLVECFGFEEALLHGEPIRLDLCEPSRGIIPVTISFRGKGRVFFSKTPAPIFGKKH
jgi:hypothetical protein